ncbi:ATP synthase subunit I [Clostridium tagluense]|uniref:ATP synthase subunit I n=1 Tax=Clostridium tagluense TaxID=360422 RepID=UPI001C0DDB74|nr:ATP synthase subunit I [Clostridium tagluense]MBU3127364.1 ATP synthase subunit I [Clostridium tagluense]MCB2311162.1 ATP synthase subunit I [Clostridium tagluense]MCB2315886.1 ATP synthase subunit I [Clostridium tagluense]MCB2320767.1 ATP synthase subunit I [Clostridium tagluense]MCB2325784.1 ATP synthase subunit I [Clostridium tagluense]
MNSDFKNMFKKILVYDFFISLIFTAVIYFTAKPYALFFLLGLLIAVINFYVNGITVEYSLDSKNVKNTGIIVIGSFIRVLLVSVIGFAIGRHNMFNIIAYIFGYSSQFISLVCYGLNNKNSGGK